MPDMPSQEFRRLGHEVIDWIADYLRDPRAFPVTTQALPGELKARLPASPPIAGEPMDQILADFRDLIVPGATLWNHPRFHGYFSVSSSGPGILAEALIATLNLNGMVWKSSPAATELEQVVLDWLRQWLGLPESFFGMMYDTASLSTVHALLAARAKADPAMRTLGAAPGFVVYTSEQAHSSVEKGAMALGFGQQNVRKIGLDSQYRLRVDLLEQAIHADRMAGLRPCCVVATTGTTATTSIDPVAAIADVCRRETLWLHVDAAYGGFAAMVPEHRHLLDGIERADSIVTNPHKWLFTPQDCSILYLRHKDALRGALSLVPEYLRTAEDSQVVNYMDYTMALGRRFRALKLWFVMRYFGRERVAAIHREQLALAQTLTRWIEADPRFEVSAPVPLGLVCFRLRASNEHNQQLINRLNATGQVFFTHNVLDGKFVLRWAIGNIHTTEADLTTEWDLIRSTAAGLEQ
ncbi:MAG: aminotransferase class V-fold PLP-dependent enzyme [Acidobacteria bacterium]|nr:aminotransferase class V-fold PLP-dependent enzyme [Acidobacteriota bacterium]